MTVCADLRFLSLGAAVVAASGGGMIYSMTHVSNSVLPDSLLQTLQPSPRMPVMFLGHGSPMNVIEDTRWRQSWKELGQELIAKGIVSTIADLRADLEARDARDASRSASPLKPAEDALPLDNSLLSVDQTTAQVLDWWQARQPF